MAVRRRLLASVWLACVSAACTPRPPQQPAQPPAAPPAAAVSGLNVTLMWDAPVDLDLYLTDPTSETVYFANNPSRTGARLLHDARCRHVVGAAEGPFFEQAQVEDPRSGRYRIGVDFIDACGAQDAAVSFRVVVDYAGTRRETTGIVRLEEFQAIVLEFELSRLRSGGSLTLEEVER